MAITPELFEEICRKLECSVYGLTAILEPYKLTRREFYEVVSGDKEAENRYARAKDEQISYLADEINRLTYEMQRLIREGKTYTGENVNAAVAALRVQIDSLKWLLSKLAPKKYGDKLDITPGNEPIKQVFKIGDTQIEM